MSALTEAVRTALGQANMTEATSDIKRLLCDELARVDPSAQIHRTEYFNHTYVPDVVLGWPHGERREVFVRFVTSPERLIADSDRLGAAGPIFVDLATAARPDRNQEEVAAAEAAGGLAAEHSPRLLVTDTDATEHIRPSASENLIEHLVVSNLLRGGRGQLNEPRAQATVKAARAGYTAAMGAEPDEVRAAVEATRQVLDPDIERRVERSLQLLWWVGGGAAAEFPVTVPDDMELNPADTRDFLQMVFSDDQDIEDDAFWDRLAERLTFDTLVGVGDVERSANLNRLMRPLARRLHLSHVALDARDPEFFDNLAWSLSDEFLRLRGPGWLCRFTPLGTRFSQRRDEGATVSLAEAVDRTAQMVVDDAELDEAERRIQLTRTPADPTQHPGPATLTNLAAGFGVDAAVRSVTIIRGQHRFTADFDRMLVRSNEATVADMAAVAVRLLTVTNEDFQVQLQTFLGL